MRPLDGVVRCVRAEIGERGCFGEWRMCGEGLELVWRPRDWGWRTAEVRTMYKPKDRKVNPVDVPLPGGVNPSGGVWGRERTAVKTGRGDEV